MNQEMSDEEVQSDDTGCISNLSEYNTDHAEEFEQSLEIRALNIHTKHCIIYCYYIIGDVSSVCASCMIDLSDMDIGNVSCQEEQYRFFRCARWQVMLELQRCTLYFRAICATLYILKNYSEQYCKRTREMCRKIVIHRAETCEYRRILTKIASFLCNREIGICVVNQGVVVNDDDDDEKQYWFG